MFGLIIVIATVASLQTQAADLKSALTAKCKYQLNKQVPLVYPDMDLSGNLSSIMFSTRPKDDANGRIFLSASLNNLNKEQFVVSLNRISKADKDKSKGKTSDMAILSLDSPEDVKNKLLKLEYKVRRNKIKVECQFID